MRQKRTEAIIGFLSFAPEAASRAAELGKFREHDWARALNWLDESALALYFLQRLKQANSLGMVPPPIVSGLEQRFTANQERLAAMKLQFDVLNQAFHRAGVRFTVMKGFSLVPQFCPDASLRHQSDFDYLIDQPSLAPAQEVLAQVGYSPKTNSDAEFTFCLPGMRTPLSNAEQYNVETPHTVELHLDVWDSNEHCVFLTEPRFLDHPKTNQWDGLVFPALHDEDAFLLQVLHAVQHFLRYWLRMSWLFEIGHFLNSRATDSSLWSRVDQRIGNNTMLREFVVIVTELVSQFFAAPVPPAIRVWAQQLRPAPRVWTELYARQWALGRFPVYEFSLFPPSKLVLFLHQQYITAPDIRKRFMRERLLPSARLSRIGRLIKARPASILPSGSKKPERIMSRLFFHSMASLRYLCEVPRWRWRNALAAQSAVVRKATSPRLEIKGST